MVNVYGLAFTSIGNTQSSTNSSTNNLNIALIAIGGVAFIFLITFVIVISCFVGGVSAGRGSRVHGCGRHGIGHRGFGRR